MVEKAWVWAHEHKVLRKNEVHGEEEARLILSEDFDLLDEEGQEISMNGALEMEDDTGYLLKDELPSVHASNADVLAGKIGAPPRVQGMQGKLSNLSARLLASSALAVLHARESQFYGFVRFVLKDQIKESLKALKLFFKELQNKQADAINRHPDKPVS
eukprot:s454_g7.t1